ncbi:hypothetical protein EVAR_68491_1 [Eumeta japonica]|uniref:Uncharacterized protein n=1 Tax=Eumeta variegata TaxID=151549 RepID=A0A4C1ZUD3_EUMVA|nr:hypothetical protein EVAR_68491_1 [Eumeta japonica]
MGNRSPYTRNTVALKPAERKAPGARPGFSRQWELALAARARAPTPARLNCSTNTKLDSNSKRAIGCSTRKCQFKLGRAAIFVVLCVVLFRKCYRARGARRESGRNKDINKKKLFAEDLAGSRDSNFPNLDMERNMNTIKFKSDVERAPTFRYTDEIIEGDRFNIYTIGIHAHAVKIQLIPYRTFFFTVHISEDRPILTVVDSCTNRGWRMDVARKSDHSAHDRRRAVDALRLGSRSKLTPPAGIGFG